jgi:uncharacterized membrane protein
MSDLVFIAFPTEQKAEEVREKVLEMQKEYLIELSDAVWSRLRMSMAASSSIS